MLLQLPAEPLYNKIIFSTLITQKEAAMTTSRHPTPETNQNPALPSPEELIEQYAALIWKICSRYLSNPEDIKECVNDTFLAFYMQSEKFDPRKGSVPALLSAIARNKAVSLARKNRSYAGNYGNGGSSEKDIGQAASSGRFTSLDMEDIPDPDTTDDRLIERMDLEAAMDSLTPEEFDLIRMKYYDGMTIREIAESMNLPYETVKKRHQRSLGKLRRYLTLTLIILVIAAVLSACAYIILHYFNIIPGYGVTRTDSDAVFYVLDEEVSTEAGQYDITLTRAFLYNGKLGAEFIIHSTEPVESYTDGFPWYGELSRYWSVDNGDECFQATATEDGYSLDETTQRTSCTVPFSASDLRDEMVLVNEKAGLTIPFRLISSESLPAESYGYEMRELGGFAVDAYMEDGHLMADIYSLSSDEFAIYPEGLLTIDKGSVTAESADGNSLNGTFIQSMFHSSSVESAPTVQTFDFGPADPGSYTIRIDTPALKADLPEDLYIPLAELHDAAGDKSYDIPEGTVVFGTPLTENPLLEGKPESTPDSEGSVSFTLPEGGSATSAPISELPASEDTEENESESPTANEAETTPEYEEADPMTTFYYPLEVTPNREDLIFDQITFNLELIDSPGEHLPFPNGFHTVLDPEDFFMWGVSFSWQETPDSGIDDLYRGGSSEDPRMGSSDISYGWDYTFEIPVTAE